MAKRTYIGLSTDNYQQRGYLPFAIGHDKKEVLSKAMVTDFRLLQTILLK